VTYREYKNLDALKPLAFGNRKLIYLHFTDEETRKIVFRDITMGDVDHTTIFDSATVTDYRSVVGYFAQVIMKELRLVSGYDVLYCKIKEFITSSLYTTPLHLCCLMT